MDTAEAAKPQGPLEAQQTILNSLSFPAMRDREEMIHNAYQNTYQWIFQDPEDEFKRRDSLVSFLRGDGTTYWITGKPGSGKSTLMKYVFHDTRTREALQLWAGGRIPVMAGFYFYYKGNELQKSEVGVLRSLLSQVLRRRPKLIPIAFPDWYHGLAQGGVFQPELSLTPQGLQRALERLIQCSPDTHFFFVVDGLDEYAADSADLALLVQTFKSLSQQSNCKILLSSRPWTVFEENFADCPRLQVNELTRIDICNYVQGQFSGHERMLKLLMTDRLAILELTERIADSSSGVFLWVYLVVRALLEGLSDSDEATDVLRRLSGLPTDLEELYYYMWNQLPHSSQAQTSRLLQTVDFCTSEGRQVSLLGLSLLEDGDPDLVYKKPVGPIEPREIRSRYQSMGDLLTSRCFGLVQVRRFAECPAPTGSQVVGDVYFNPTEDALGSPHVTFIHRTVHEFVHTRNIRDVLHQAAEADETHGQFCPEVAALRLYISRVKTYQWAPFADSVFSVTFATLIHRCLETALAAETASRMPQRRLLVELDAAMTQLYAIHGKKPPRGHWLGGLNIYGRDDSDRPIRHARSGFLCLAVRYGLTRYVRKALAEMPALEDGGCALLDSIIHQFRTEVFYPTPKPSMRVVFEMLHLLVNHGADVNYKYCGTTASLQFLDWISLGDEVFTNHDLPNLPAIARFFFVGCPSHDSKMVERAIAACEKLLGLTSKANPELHDQADLNAFSEGMQQVIGEMSDMMRN